MEQNSWHPKYKEWNGQGSNMKSLHGHPAVQYTTSFLCIIMEMLKKFKKYSSFKHRMSTNASYGNQYNSIYISIKLKKYYHLLKYTHSGLHHISIRKWCDKNKTDHRISRTQQIANYKHVGILGCKFNYATTIIG